MPAKPQVYTGVGIDLLSKFELHQHETMLLVHMHQHSLLMGMDKA